MKHYSKEDIIRMVEEEDVEFIRLQFTDMFGNLKNIAITCNHLDRALDNKYIIDGSSVYGVARDMEDEMYLYPDLDTFNIFPWRPQQGKVARLICSVHTLDGKPCIADPRYILQRVVDKAREEDIHFIVRPECEFYLFHTDELGRPTTITHENAGFYDMGPFDLGENVRRDIILTLEDMGFEIESSHHEGDRAQHEIDFKRGKPVEIADNFMTFKLAVKMVAKKHGLHASFMPKPLNDGCGSGMHINFSVFRELKNVFYDETDENKLSETGYYFIGGILKHIKAITAISNPIVNSYKRLVDGNEIPNRICYAKSAQSPLIRIPHQDAQSSRVELRSPDPSCNPYLTLAVCLAAGMDGIENKISPKQYDLKNFNDVLECEPLPSNLKEALEELEKDEFIINVIGKDYLNRYIKAKKKEWKSYNECITDWEINNYLSRC